MKTITLCAALAAFLVLVSCDNRVNTSPSGDALEKDTTIINPPSIEGNDTIILNPPGETNRPNL